MSPASAIAWEFRHRNRWGLLAVAVILVVITAIKLTLVISGRVIALDDAEAVAIVLTVPLSCAYTYFVAVFTYGLSGDVAARESMYPARMLALPVTTAALAGWPMLYGAAVVAFLWTLSRPLGVWPSTVHVPVFWPGLLAISQLAWAQALTWMPYGLRGMRVIAVMLLLVMIDVVVLLALHFQAPEWLMAAFLAPQVPLAYLVARYAVGRARRGDVPDWSGTFAGVGSVHRRRASFRSPARAQAWFEWRRHGLTLPVWVAILLPFELTLLWVAGDSKALVLVILIGAGLTPPIMASFTAAAVRKSNPDARDSLGVSPFIATRPLTSVALIAAKLKMTLWSAAVAWVVVLVAVPLALAWSHTWPVAAGRARALSAVIGAPRTTVFLLLVLVALMASTWKQLVQSLWVGLSGREWVVKTSVSIALLVLCAIGPVLVWIAENRRVIAVLWDAMHWILAVLVAIKMAVAIWVAVRLDRAKVLGDYALIGGAALWLAAVLAVWGVLVWLLWTPLFPRDFLMLVAILFVPLVRVSAAPLALAWNRHR